MRLLALVTFQVIALASAPGDASAKARVGQRAPWFKLKTVLGRTVTRDSLRGSVAALVVGQTRKSAPPCKKWVLALLKKTSAEVFQVIVADKPWYIPRGVVMSQIKDFTPKPQWGRVLVEWYKVFAEQYRVPKDDDPRVIVIDKKGIIRRRFRGVMTARSLQTMTSAIRRLDVP